jgi:hypothetical protein
MEEKQQKFETWAVVEIMGHQRIAGMCSEQSIAGSNLLRVDVPEVEVNRQDWEGGGTEKIAGFTTYIGGSSIYRLTPCTEAVARKAIEQFRARPVQCVDLSPAKLLPATSGSDGGDAEGSFGAYGASPSDDE